MRDATFEWYEGYYADHVFNCKYCPWMPKSSNKFGQIKGLRHHMYMKHYETLLIIGLDIEGAIA